MLAPYSNKDKEAILKNSNATMNDDEYMKNRFGYTAKELFTEKGFDFSLICSISTDIVVDEIANWNELRIDNACNETKKGIEAYFYDKISDIDLKYCNGQIDAKEYISLIGKLIA